MGGRSITAGTGQQRREVTCSGGLGGLHEACPVAAKCLRKVRGEGDNVLARTLLQVLRGLLCFTRSRENLFDARPSASLPWDHLLLVLRRAVIQVGPWWMGCCPGSGRGALLGPGRTAAQNKDSENVMCSVGVREHLPEVLPDVLPLFTMSMTSPRQERLSNISHS